MDFLQQPATFYECRVRLLDCRNLIEICRMRAEMCWGSYENLDHDGLAVPAGGRVLGADGAADKWYILIAWFWLCGNLFVALCRFPHLSKFSFRSVVRAGTTPLVLCLTILTSKYFRQRITRETEKVWAMYWASTLCPIKTRQYFDIWRSEYRRLFIPTTYCNSTDSLIYTLFYIRQSLKSVLDWVGSQYHGQETECCR